MNTTSGGNNVRDGILPDRYDESRSEAALYLIPVGMSDAPYGDVLPAGNMRIIKGIRHFIVENVRSARRFLKRCDPSVDITALVFSELNRHTDLRDVSAMLETLRRGEPVGVMSDAGCPAVADPGALAVAEAQRRSYRVCPLVGPSSILLALMASGFNGQTFAFAGYLPYENEARNKALREMQRRIEREGQTQIFIETPYRNNKLIAELCRRLPGHMLLCVASDLTGPRQSVITLPLEKWAKTAYNYDKTPTIFLLYN